jgi:hypothetical protein
MGVYLVEGKYLTRGSSTCMRYASYSSDTYLKGTSEGVQNKSEVDVALREEEVASCKVVVTTKRKSSPLRALPTSTCTIPVTKKQAQIHAQMSWLRRKYSHASDYCRYWQSTLSSLGLCEQVLGRPSCEVGLGLGVGLQEGGGPQLLPFKVKRIVNSRAAFTDSHTIELSGRCKSRLQTRRTICGKG